MKNILQRILDSFFLCPPYIRHCSQTIYEALLGCLRLWDATKDKVWKERAETVCRILLSIQRPDGGFDIGYEFNFGRKHKKGESTSPELVGLLALVEYYKRFGGSDVESAAHHAASWIRKHAFKLSDNCWAVPYGPYSTKEVMVYNGTSFAAGALGVYLSVFHDTELETICHGMNAYLYGAMCISPNQPGKFWYYNDQDRTDLDQLQRDKIDYYHQMQQVEMHAAAGLNFSSPHQVDIICSATEHVAFKQDENGLVPYANREGYFREGIHLWGFCSCASGFLMAGKICSTRIAEYRKRAEKILNWIYKYAWNGMHFYRLVSKEGLAKDRRFYVRSDAWVFNSFALAVKEGIEVGKYLDVCEKSYASMEDADFSGLENHASNKRIRCVKHVIQKAVACKNKIWPK